VWRYQEKGEDERRRRVRRGQDGRNEKRGLKREA
jgi:hypothetical protein